MGSSQRWIWNCRLLGLMEDLGMPWERLDGEVPRKDCAGDAPLSSTGERLIAWTGRRLLLGTSAGCGRISNSDIAHEIAHGMVCKVRAPREFRMRNWGFERRRNDWLWVGDREAEAQDLTAVLLRRVGLPWRKELALSERWSVGESSAALASLRPGGSPFPWSRWRAWYAEAEHRVEDFKPLLPARRTRASHRG